MADALAEIRTTPTETLSDRLRKDMPQAFDGTPEPTMPDEPSFFDKAGAQLRGTGAAIAGFAPKFIEGIDRSAGAVLGAVPGDNPVSRGARKAGRSISAYADRLGADTDANRQAILGDSERIAPINAAAGEVLTAFPLNLARYVVAGPLGGAAMSMAENAGARPEESTANILAEGAKWAGADRVGSALESASRSPMGRMVTDLGLNAGLDVVLRGAGALYNARALRKATASANAAGAEQLSIQARAMKQAEESAAQAASLESAAKMQAEQAAQMAEARLMAEQPSATSALLRAERDKQLAARNAPPPAVPFELPAPQQGVAPIPMRQAVENFRQPWVDAAKAEETLAATQALRQTERETAQNVERFNTDLTAAAAEAHRNALGRVAIGIREAEEAAAAERAATAGMTVSQKMARERLLAARDRRGALDPALLMAGGRAVAGGALGASQGDTPEEQLLYGLGGAAAGAFAPQIIKATKDLPAGLSLKTLDQTQPETVSQLRKYLLPEEFGKLVDKTAISVSNLLTKLPTTDEMAAVAYGGRAKRGWYQNSAQALRDVFGPDATRFASLLAAMSPQTSVESNLQNALKMWKNWTAAGRPTEAAEITRLMGQSVAGSKAEESVLDAWKNNSIRALTHESPELVMISGPKVNSFFRNLIGHTQEVTNDAWMANYALVDQKIFGGSLNKAMTDPGKGSGYLAMSARVRQTADRLSELTGEVWTPAEVQETVWSWAKTLYELGIAKGETRTIPELLKAGALTDDLIAATPDFHVLLGDGIYGDILKEAGYGDALGKLKRPAGGVDALGSKVRGVAGEAGPFAPATQRQHELTAAGRLEQLRLNRSADAAREVAHKEATAFGKLTNSLNRATRPWAQYAREALDYGMGASDLRAAARTSNDKELAEAAEFVTQHAKLSPRVESSQQALVQAETARDAFLSGGMRGDRAGAVDPRVIAALGRGAVGAVGGSLGGASLGETPEGKRKGALLGGLAGAAALAGGPLAFRALQKAVPAQGLTPALANISDAVARGERSPAAAAGFLSGAEKRYAEIVDEAYPLSKFGRTFDTATPERLAQQVAQGQGHKGMSDLYMREQLAPLFQKLKGYEEAFGNYAVAKREQQLRAKGGAPKIAKTDAEINAAVADGDANPLLAQAQQDLTAVHRDLLKQRLDVGLITPDQYHAIVASEDFYTPFKREWNAESGRKTGQSAGFVNTRSGVETMAKGEIASADITDPMELAMAAVASTFRQVAKQKVTNIVGDIVGQHGGDIVGLLREVPAGTTPHHQARIVSPLINGVVRRFEVVAPEFYDAWASFDPRVMGWGEKILNAAKRTLQTGVTLMPDFAIANLTRDSGQAAVQQPLRALGKRAGIGAGLGAAVGADSDSDRPLFEKMLVGAGFGAGAGGLGGQAFKALKAMGSIVKDDALYRDFLREGGMTEGFYPRNASDARKAVEALQRTGVSKADIITPRRWVDALRYIGSVTEQSTRLAKFAEMRAAGASGAESALAAHDVSLRFANSGSKTKGLASTTAFWNAKVQGWDKLARLIKNPKTWAAGAATITAPTMALWELNKDNPEYQARPQWEKNLFWLVPKPEGEGFFRIAKPFELGFLFASLPERMFDYAYARSKGEDANPAETLRAAAAEMANTTADGTLPIPTGLNLLLEQMQNKDRFRNRAIVRNEKLPAGMQEDEATSSTARILGGSVGVSPQRIDHLVGGLTGGGGKMAVGAMDWALRKAGTDETPEPVGKPNLLVRRFQTTEGAMSDQEAAVRRRFKNADTYYQGYQKKRASGDGEAAEAYAAKHLPELEQRAMLERVVQRLDALSERRRKVQATKELSPAERLQMTKDIRQQGYELSKYALSSTP